MSSPFTLPLVQALTDHQIILENEAIIKLTDFLELLQRWNRVFNLTSLQDPKESVYLHLIDSLLIMPYLQGHLHLDVGSGGGLPGIPLAIAAPEKQWVLIDKNSKKTRFLTQAVSDLSLKNIKIVHDRCESFQHSSGFDSILSRAFGTLRKMIDATEHLLSPQGVWIAMKGQYPTEELCDLPDHVSYRVKQLNIHGMNVTRHVVLLGRKNK